MHPAMFVASIIILAGIFILSLVVGSYYKFGVRHSWFFETMHFLGGFFVAMFFSNFTSSTYLILAYLCIVIFLWELMEILNARIPLLTKFIKKTIKLKLEDITPKWRDTVLDIILDFAGALLFIYFFHQ